MAQYDFPSNADKKTINPTVNEPPKVESVVTGAASVKPPKKSNVVWDAIKTAGKYVWDNVLKPAGKKMLYDGVNAASSSIIYGKAVPPQNNGVPASRVSYRSCYYDNAQPYRGSESAPRQQAYSTLEYNNISFTNRADAESVLRGLYDALDTYGIVSVATLYSLAGIASQFTANNYGWTNLNGARIIPDGAGWTLELPKAYPINH